MKIYRCRICGDVYIGKEKPTDCPFCGVPEKYIVFGKEWIDENENLELSEASKKNLETALKLELNATSLYSCISKKNDNMEIKSFFKGLAKVEKEHVALLVKALKISKEELEQIEAECTSDTKEMLEKTIKLEDDATQIYANSAREATEERVKDIFVALSATEKGHSVLAKELLG